MTLPLLSRAYCPGCGRMARPGARSLRCRCGWEGDLLTLREILDAGPGEYVSDDVDIAMLAQRVRAAVDQGVEVGRCAGGSEGTTGGDAVSRKPTSPMPCPNCGEGMRGPVTMTVDGRMLGLSGGWAQRDRYTCLGCGTVVVVPRNGGKS